MNTRTGRIYEAPDDPRTVSRKTETILTPGEYKALQKFPEPLRPMELANARFVQSREKIGAPHGLHIQNAFRLGYMAALKDQGVKSGHDA